MRSLTGWASRELWCPAYRVEHIETATGSGDSSIAGFLAALVRGHGVEDALHLANCAGCHNLSGPDAVSGLRDWDRVVADAASLPLRDVPVSGAPDWTCHSDGRLWECYG